MRFSVVLIGFLLLSCTLKKEEPELLRNYERIFEFETSELPYRAISHTDTSLTFAILRPDTLVLTRLYLGENVIRKDLLKVEFSYERPLHDVAGNSEIILVSVADTLFLYQFEGDSLVLAGEYGVNGEYRSIYVTGSSEFIALKDDSSIYRVSLPELEEEELFDLGSTDSKIEVSDTFLLTTAGYLYTFGDSLILNVSQSGKSYTFCGDYIVGTSRTYNPYFVRFKIPQGESDYIGAFGAPYVALPLVFGETLYYVGFDEKPQPLRRSILPVIMREEREFPPHYLIKHVSSQ